MQEADVAQAIETLREQGKAPSIGNLRKVLEHGSLRDITRHRRTLLPHMGRGRMDTTAVADTPAPAAPPPPPVPLLVQVEQHLQAALVAERQAQRAYHLATDPEERTRCQQGWFAARKARERAETRLGQLTRSLAARKEAIPGLRIAARRAAGEHQAVEEQMCRMVQKALRERTAAEEELARVLGDIVMLAGADAVPREDGV
jgi:hypothetical protein